MKQVRIPEARIEIERVRFIGGLDMMSPALDIQPGNAIVAVNYEPGMLGGYKRIDGYERLDGRPAPSAATYLYLQGSFPYVAIGTQVRGATSGAIGIVVMCDGTPAPSASTGSISVSKVSGSFQDGETITRMDASVLGTLGTAIVRGYPDSLRDATALAAAADLYRADIQAVPGVGPIRGVWMFGGVTYAFRDYDGTQCKMYKSTSAGWAAVTFGQELQVKQPSQAVTTSSGAVNWAAHGLSVGALVQFGGTIPSGASANTSYYVVATTANTFQVSLTAGGAAIVLGDVAAGLTCYPQAQQLVEGTTVTGATSGATGVVARAGVRTGAWASFGVTATIVLSSSSGTFQAGELLRVAGAPMANAVAANAPITLLPGGRFEFVTYNFTGSLATRRMYFCDGVNPAFEFDGTTLAPIRTGMAADTPQFIRAHKQKLFLSFKGSVQHSGDGAPYAWTILAGADEIGIGDVVTGMEVQAGDTLAIFARNSSYQLNGSTNDDFQLLPISDKIGAIAYTVQAIGKTLALADRGIVSTDRTQAYGNFVQSTISQYVQPIVDKLRANAIGSVVYRNRNQYRIFAADGSGVIVTFNDGNLVGITRLQYPTTPACFASCEDATGGNVVLFGDVNGYVYQADVGSSFDGQAIEAYLHLPFDNFGSPRQRKRFRKAVMEMSATAYSSIRFQPEFSYGDPDIGTHRLQTASIGGNGGYWDTDNWDAFFYDAQVVTAPEFSIEGKGLNMSAQFYSNSNIDMGHVLQGLLVHFSNLRLSR
jgi:hypothetical protein